MPPETDTLAPPSGADTPAPASSTEAAAPVDRSSDARPASSPAERTSDAPPPSSRGPEAERLDLLKAVKEAVPFKPEPDVLAEPPEHPDGEPASPRQPAETRATPTETTTSRTTDGTTSREPVPDPTPDELATWKPDTRRRFEELLQQRNAARLEATTLKDDAQRHRDFTNYLQQADLAVEDVNLLLGVGATLRKGDFQGFLNGVLPYVQMAQEACGYALPRDLQSKVDEGTIDRDTAAELSRTRYRAVRAEGDAQTAQQVSVQQHQQAHALGIQDAVNNWEAGVRQRDPDYAGKQEAVWRFATSFVQERGRYPRDQAEAIQWAKEAYDIANRMVKAAKPPPRPTALVPDGSRVVSSNAEPFPKTMKEAAIQALRRMHAGGSA